MSKIIAATGWFGQEFGYNKGKVHMVADGLPVCGARPKGQFQWCAYGANYQYTDCELCRRYYDKYEANVLKEQPQVITNVGNCARCHGDHLVLTFKKFTHVQGQWTHWALCPRSQEPILLKVLLV